MNYCFECGSKLVEKECINCGISEGMVPYCPVCGEFRFPFFNSAVSMVIFNKDLTKTLLIRQYGNDKNILVAGYVNKGENLETALVRELKEEYPDLLVFDSDRNLPEPEIRKLEKAGHYPVFYVDRRGFRTVDL